MPRKHSRAINIFTRKPSGLCATAASALAMASGLYDFSHPYFTSACASGMVIFSGVCAMAKGINSCQCFGRVNRPATSNLLYSGVAGNGVSNPKIGNPGGQVRISCKVRSATPTVSLSMPKINEVIANTLRSASR